MSSNLMSAPNIILISNFSCPLERILSKDIVPERDTKNLRRAEEM